MNVQVNGEPREVPEGTTVSGLLELLGVAAGRAAVEVNRELVRRERHPEHRLAEADRIEIVTFVGGG